MKNLLLILLIVVILMVGYEFLASPTSVVLQNSVTLQNSMVQPEPQVIVVTATPDLSNFSPSTAESCRQAAVEGLQTTSLCTEYFAALGTGR